MDADYIAFTEEMKRDYTILVPNMLPMHFKMILEILGCYGYRMELLETTDRAISECGLKYVHNDTCYPAILVIGQFVTALQSGKYDPDKVALMLFQTGGGCRASNYIPLLRKALGRAGYPQVPVISFSFAGLEKHPGWHLTLPILRRMLHAVFYGDLLMLLSNQCKPYELEPGSTDALAAAWTHRIAEEMKQKKNVRRSAVRRTYRAILRDFAALPRSGEKKIRVGVVGEIFVKYSPLGNNNLEDFLLSEGAEVVVPGLLGFVMYSLYDNLMDTRLYKVNKLKYPMWCIAYRFFRRREDEFIRCIREEGTFEPPRNFSETVSLREGYIGLGAKMGEGWLLTAEMLELAREGVKNIVCTQPFGCLPNHICGKGMMRPIKEKNPDVNIVAIDYDAGATRVNQENRIKLMLSNARRQQDEDDASAKRLIS